VPGASDNATGVAVCLDLARHLAAEPLEGVEVLVALTGAEEAGMGGMAAFFDRHPGFDPRATFVLGLDTPGAGAPIACRAEGAMREHPYAERDLALVEEGAAAVGLAAPRWRIGGWTDPILAVHRGVPAASLLSMGPGYFPHYHHPSDTPDNVDWGSVEACARVAAGTIAAFERRVAEGSWR
jgi:Zn-dependent M28 family amino/carboxypeptidase